MVFFILINSTINNTQGDDYIYFPWTIENLNNRLTMKYIAALTELCQKLDIIFFFCGLFDYNHPVFRMFVCMSECYNCMRVECSAIIQQLVRVLPESPNWLLARGRFEETIRLVRTIASTNGRDLTPDFIVATKVR